jgi:hypothetical protein
MAEQMSVMMFGKHKGQMIQEVPTDYLIWALGSFPKLRNKLREVLEQRGLSRNQIQILSSRHKVLSNEPESDEKRRQKLLKPRKVRRTEQQKQANDAARAMGRQVPYPRYQQPRELRYFTRGN